MIKSVLLTAAVMSIATISLAADVAAPLAVTSTIHIGGPGRWDYLSVDPETHNLYVTRSTHEQVIDPAAGKVIADIPGGEGLHGTAIVPSAGRAFVTDGKAAKLLVVDLKTYKMLGSIDAAEDADGAIYSPAADRVLVSCGDAAQMLILDPHADVATAKVQKVDLGGKPEFLAADDAGRAFVCINDKNEIAVVDIKTATVTARWPIGSGTAPMGAAIDAKAGHLFIGCRNEKLIVLNTADGKVLAEVPIGRGNDACAFDPATGHAYASCGDGTLAVIGETEPGKFAVVQTVKTMAGARTVGIDTASHAIYLPAAEMNPAEQGKRPTPKPDSFSIVVVK